MFSFPRLFVIICFSISLITSFIYLEKSSEGISPVNNHTFQSKKKVTVDDFFKLLTSDDKNVRNAIIDKIDKNWDESLEIFVLETIYFSRDLELDNKLSVLFSKKTGQKRIKSFDSWFQYIWNKKATYPNEYFEFKARIHQNIDSKFYNYFSNRSEQSVIRLDEVRWGGVLQDGIPPLRNPEMITADSANYLDDDNIVFGIEVNGDARAYPKRILAWHEMFVDTVGDVPVAGVYCTLCGTVILYKTEHEGVNYKLGTSGFLYRSNKLMYDKKTQSLWSTLEGEPVIGPLVGKGITLDYLSVVTTTWGEWKKLHPETSVLSLKTGHRRDYGEGVAYKSYFATDDLMFTIPKIDTSLKNKDEILALRLPEETDENIAISSKYLRKNPIYSAALGDIPFTVFTDKSGAHRMFFTKGKKFKSYDRATKAVDENGIQWTISENKMTSENGDRLERFPTHNAFWFGYKAAFPDTKLIK
ncbi:DUF3179 domain-containing protein [Maribacter sp. 2210JD10-5]|uniref:DUF3179 domain-containing protein n=1 Tax=Maribacter sp. 2210JD10-5 TaxID=3386272 RepID=UPI0039BCA002